MSRNQSISQESLISNPDMNDYNEQLNPADIAFNIKNQINDYQISQKR
jgi:hypothetical protein